jgi:hypothetical protein
MLFYQLFTELKNSIFWDITPFSPLKVVDFQRSTRSYIPENITLHNHRCERLKSYILPELFLIILYVKMLGGV